MSEDIAPLEEPTAGLTVAQMEAIEVAVGDARSSNTRGTYASALRQFESWCLVNRQPFLPTGPGVVAAYIVETAATKSMSTVAVVVAAIRAVHLDGGHRNPTGHRLVEQTLSGLRRTHGTAAQTRARAFDVAELTRVLAGIDRNTVAGKRDAAILLVGFGAALRRSEISAITRADLILTPAGIELTIRRSKGDQQGVGAVVGIPAGKKPDTCPLRAMRAWLGVRGRVQAHLTVFCRVTRTGATLLGGLSPQSINTVLQTRAAAAGVDLERLTAHSLRASHISVAARAGAPLQTILETTRHKNLATLAGYIRDARAIEDSSGNKLGL